MRCRPSDRADFSASDGVLFDVLTTLSSIVTSRKRKLRELFAVATHADALPQDAFGTTDAPAPTPAEWNFLQASDILQYVRAIDSRFFCAHPGAFGAVAPFRRCTLRRRRDQVTDKLAEARN